MIKNTFYFILKTLFLSPMYLNFCNEFLFMQKNSLIRKLRLISKLMKLHLGEQTIAIDILPNILRSKCNQTMKFDQLIEYNMRNIFLEKSYTQCVGDTIPWPFSKESKFSISLDQQCQILYSLSFIYVQVEVYQNILKLRC